MYNLLEPVELNRSYDQRIGKLQSSGAAAFSSIIGTTKKSRSRSASNYLPPFATDASSRMLRSLEPQRIGHPHYSAGQGKAGAPGDNPYADADRVLFVNAQGMFVVVTATSQQPTQQWDNNLLKRRKKHQRRRRQTQQQHTRRMAIGNTVKVLDR